MRRSAISTGKNKALAVGRRATPSSGWIASGSVAAIAPLIMSVAACSGPGDMSAAGTSAENGGSTSEAIYGGVADNDASKNDSVVALKIGDSTQSFELCSASVIAPNVLLTARHCVSKNIVDSIACDQNGQSQNGNHFGDDEDPTTMHVFSGATPDLRNGTPIANGKAIFHTQTSVLCNADLAILVLDRNVAIPPMRVRLSSKTSSGEQIRSVGYGENDKGLAVGTRLRKDGVAILATGTTVSKFGTPLATNEMEVGLSICQGDSGGPAISETTGAIIGVVSRGGSCTDTFGHIYTLAAGFEPIFEEAFALAGGRWTEESAPVAPATGGAADAGTSPTAEKDAAAPPVKNDTTSDSTGASDTPAGSGTKSPVNLRAGAGAGSCAMRAGDLNRGYEGFVFASGVAIAALGMRRRRRR